MPRGKKLDERFRGEDGRYAGEVKLLARIPIGYRDALKILKDKKQITSINDGIIKAIYLYLKKEGF